MTYYTRVLLIVTVSFITGLPSMVLGEDSLTQEEMTKVSVKGVWAPYCGLYCVYAAIGLNGGQLEYANLIKPDYCGSSKGSTLAELSRAAKDNGMFVAALTKMTSLELRHCQHPVILHVKRDNSVEYNHYELFMGTEGGLAKLYDPPNPIRLVPFYELEPDWDGIGLVISRTPIDIGNILAPARIRCIVYATLAISIVLAVRLIKWRWLRLLPRMTQTYLVMISITQALVVVILAILCGLSYHFVDNRGFLAHANATASVQKAHIGSFIPKINKEKVTKLLNLDTVFIDARYAQDFKAGHIEGAISIPVDANDIERKEAIAGIAKNTHIVVYCQSKGCPFAEKVTRKLKADGFHNISIFKDGWNEWKTKNND